MKKASEDANGVSTSAETEQEYTIAWFPKVHQERICRCYLSRHIGAKGQAADSGPFAAQPGHRARFRQRADPWIIVDELIGAWSARERANEAHDVRVLRTKLVVSTVAADDDVSAGLEHGPWLH